MAGQHWQAKRALAVAEDTDKTERQKLGYGCMHCVRCQSMFGMKLVIKKFLFKAA
jgi:hypothetical protein